MTKEYKVQELSNLIQLSRQAIYDKIESNEFKIIERRIKGKKIKFVVLSDKEHEGLIEQYGLRQSSQHENTLNGVNQVYSQEKKHDGKELENVINSNDTVERILSFTEKYIQELKNLNQENRELYSQVKLIEDKQRTAKDDSEFYKSKYFELQQKNEQLQKENQQLKKQSEKKWWKRVKVF